MVITPSTDLYLVKVPLEISQDNQLTFANATAQYNYFSSLPRLFGDGNFTYQRKDGVIRFGALIDDIMEYNYVMYRNDAHSDKWFYAFITNMEYKSDSVTYITIKTDVWQTYQFQLNFKATFVEREHVNDDTIGLHTVRENLEKGDFVCNSITQIGASPSDITWPAGYTYEGGNYLIGFQVSELLSSIYSVSNIPQNYNGVYSGLFIIAVDNAYDALEFIRGYDSEAKGDAIVSCFLTLPHFFNAGYVQAIGTHGHNARIYPAKVGDTAIKINPNNITINLPTTLNGYTPKNNKLFTGEYNYLYADNNAGSSSVFNYELFTGNIATFGMYGSVGQGNNIKLIPFSYKNGDNSLYGNYQEGINASKLPICAFTSDYYLNWQTQNGINFGSMWIPTAVIQHGTHLLTSPTETGGGKSLLGTIVDSMLEQRQADLVPNQSKGNVGCSDINVGYHNLSALAPANKATLFTIKNMSVKAEFAKQIDSYMSMFGYKVNEVKLPNITGRRNWNYVKTIGCYIEADIPQDDLQEIKSMFDRGITFWHNPATFADYTQSNDIL